MNQNPNLLVGAVAPQPAAPQPVTPLPAAFAAVCVAAVLAGCGGDSDGNEFDASNDATFDTADHGSWDAPGDGGGDASPDGADDAGDGDSDDIIDAFDGGGGGCAAPTGEVAFQAFELGDWTVEVDRVSGAWAVTPPHLDTPVLRAPPLCRVDGTSTVRWSRGFPEVQNEFGAFRFRDDTRSSSLVWHVPSDLAEVEADATRVTLRYRVDGIDDAGLRLSVFDEHLRIELLGDGDGGDFAWSANADEEFYGLGAQVVGMNLRGRTYPLWTQEQGNGKPDNPVGWPLQNYPEASYAPAGVWHSSAGYSAVVTHDAYSAIQLGPAPSLRSIGHNPGFVLVRGDTPQRRLTAITAYTGRPTMPPDWVFAPWNDAVGGPDRLDHVADTLRNADIPSSAIWAEDWIGGSQTATGYRLSYAWAWSPEQYPALNESIASLHRRGFAFLAYFNPFVPNSVAMWDEGVAGDLLVKRADGTVRTVIDAAFRTAGLVDLTHPPAVAWLEGYMRVASADLGIDGWMCDFSEWYPLDGVPRDGSSPWETHNRYPLAFQRANRAALEAVRGRNWTFFARAGWASIHGGAGGIAPVHWGGDQNTDWLPDDGFPTVVPIAVHLGLSGVTLFGSDIAGYNSFNKPNTTKELFYRWTTFGAFSPVMRTHHGSDECGNWSFDRDGETLAHYARYARVHTRLFPLLQSLAARAAEFGLPLMRHPYLVEHANQAYVAKSGPVFFVGDNLLVAPALEVGATAVNVVLPGEGWWPLFGAEPVDEAAAADGTVSVAWSAPVTEIPAFVRPGTALVLLATAPDTFYGASDGDVTTLTGTTSRTIALYPDAVGVALGDTGDATVAATGVGRAWVAPAWNGATLGSCGDSAPPCVDGATAVVVGNGTLRDGEAVVTVDAVDGTRTWHIAIGGAAWGELATTPPSPDLGAVVPSPCE